MGIETPNLILQYKTNLPIHFKTMKEAKPDIPTPPIYPAQRASKNTKIPLRGGALIGKTVNTVYGKGICSGYREEDRMYKIQLNNGTQNDGMSAPIVYTQEVPERIHTSEDEAQELNVAYEALEKMRRLNLEMQCFDAGVTNVDHDHCTVCLLSNSIPSKRFPRLQKVYEDASVAQANAKINMKMRSLWGNKENQNSGTEPKNGFSRIRSFASANNSGATNTSAVGNFPRIAGLWGNKQTAKKQEAAPHKEQNVEDQKPAATNKRVLPRIQNLLDSRLKNQSNPCLICASPSCPDHSSASFRKDGITLCLKCERLFELDFIVNCVNEPDPQIRAKHIDHMVDCYDRCLLLLKYSARFMEDIAKTLEESKEKQNKIGLGSSGVGVLSGVLGIAAAATILTPAGPPLLIASLAFGGSATTVQVGSEALNYFSEPNKIADRVIALHGMTLSILRVTSTLRDAMMCDFIRTDGVFEADMNNITEEMQKRFEKARAGVIAGANAGRGLALGGVAMTEAGAVAGAEAGVLAARAASTEASAVAAAGATAGARGATTMSRATTAGTAAARGLRFARFAGGALSAAVLVMEANAIQRTLKSIEEGNPCEKAKTLREILDELNESSLPSTTSLDDECQAYLDAMLSRPAPLPEVTAEVAECQADDLPEAACISPDEMSELSAPGFVIVEGVDDDLSLSVSTEQGSSQAASQIDPGSSSLFERIQQRQQTLQTPSAREDEVFAVALESEQARRAQLNLLS
eukprot:scaffold22589_cov138-Cylindrotheca_fusiformis.AAC.58